MSRSLAHTHDLNPAKAGIQGQNIWARGWDTPAFAGMTPGLDDTLVCEA
jgi:hypothetical protein